MGNLADPYSVAGSRLPEAAQRGCVAVSPAEWDRLSANAAEPNPFLERWYLSPSLDLLDPSGRVSLFRTESEGGITGLLPMRRELSYYGRPVPHLAAWIHENCFLGLPLVRPGSEHAFWEALLARADARPGIALFLHLRSMPLDGKVSDALRDVLTAQKRTAAVVYREMRPVLLSGQTSGEYLAASLSSKERSELRRKQARLGELGTLSFERTTGSEELESWITAFLALEAAGWKGKAGSALAASARTGAFFRAVIEGAARHGKLERRAIVLDGRPLAMLTTFMTPPGAFGFKTAFDESFARYSPGVLLQCANLDVLDRGEITWFDSCAREGRAVMDRLWRDRRALGHLSIAIGGPRRRRLFERILRFEEHQSIEESRS